ncbi:MAG: hypothetical protein AUK47_10530 [Deltaproteobacteria bacterium CG2_30_63_29]|nr:MAG: hypothetical protein AUK47_10530 [Deltaproteobacteria bacterium CG2_30_63_29]PJB48794.1 MAG: hypothetical protein CO108_01590 [Deltaproteobacteria bacterium CG_4_9_14_3_um_filter_63_12]
MCVVLIVRALARKGQSGDWGQVSSRRSDFRAFLGTSGLEARRLRANEHGLECTKWLAVEGE